MTKINNIIYGVDTSKKITPLLVRDAIIVCFIQAHKEILEDIKDIEHFDSKEDFEKFRLLNIQLMITKIFNDLNEDFNNPTRDSLIKVIEKLREYAYNFRNQKIVSKHTQEIMLLVNKLE